MTGFQHSHDQVALLREKPDNFTTFEENGVSDKVYFLHERSKIAIKNNCPGVLRAAGYPRFTERTDI